MKREYDSFVDEMDQRLRPALLNFFARRTRNRAEAEDLTQEVFIRLVQAKNMQVRSAEAYMFQVAANLLRDRVRREKVRANYRQRQSLEEEGAYDPLDPFRVVAGRLTLAALGAAIAALPEKTRRIFVLYRIENIDKAVIARSFNCTTRSVELHVQKAMLSLFETMEGEL